MMSMPTDHLGCPLDRLSGSQVVAGRNITFLRKSSQDVQLGRVATAASDRGILVGVSTRAGHRRRILRQHHATQHDFDANAIYIRNFDEDYRADISGAFDFIQMEIPADGLDRLFDEAGASVSSRLDNVTGQADPVLSHLAQAMAPGFAMATPPSPLFIDQLAVAIGTHIVRRYGRAAAIRPTRSAGLSRAQARIAKEFLRSRLDGEIAIEDVAAACGLSRGHFSRAFRQSLGTSPYRWLLDQRLQAACDLMRAPRASLADISIACGFADQSHFTRAFTAWAGTSPARWRRNLA